MKAQPVIPDSDIGGGSGEACSLHPSIIEGRYEIIHVCRYEPGQYWTVICDGPVIMTAPLFDYTGDQVVHGNNEIDLDQHVHGNNEIDLDQHVHGNNEIDLDQVVHGNNEIDLDQHVHGNNEIDLDQHVHGHNEIDQHQIVHHYLELHAMAEPGYSPQPPEGAARTARIYLDAVDGVLKVKKTTWEELAPGVWDDEPIVGVEVLG